VTSADAAAEGTAIVVHAATASWSANSWSGITRALRVTDRAGRRYAGMTATTSATSNEGRALKA
jgi:hypothetical protein